MKRNNEEHKIQVAFFDWADNMVRCGRYPCLEKLLFAIPNGGARDARTGAILKAEGVKPGIVDAFLAVPNIRNIPWYHGLFIEFKAPAIRGVRRAGTLSEDQKIVIPQLIEQGYCVEICWSTQEGIDAVERYLR
jgi:hypothetical protein